MPPRKGATLSDFVANVSEDEFALSGVGMMPTPDSQRENRAPAKRREAAKSKAVVAGSSARVAKAKAPARRTSGASLAAAATGTSRPRKGGRKALKELESVNDNGNETEEVEEFAEEEAQPKPVKKGRTAKPRATSKTTKPTARGAPTRPPKRSGSVEPAMRSIPDTQPEPMQIEPAELQEEEEYNERPLIPATSIKPVATAGRQARSTSRQAEALIALRRRAGSASSTERGGDPALRRKLGDMTRKFEGLDLKYKQLKEIGSSDALSNFEKLRRSTEQRAQDQDSLIASLKKELAAQRSLAAESHSLRKQISTLEAENTRLTSEAKSSSKNLHTSQIEVRDLQNEVKTLTAKLSALRSSAQTESSKQTSVSKPINSRSNTAPPAIRAEDLAVMKLKEDLYSDLTGLMIRSVKTGEEEDIYDCIQTGRNGTLRFHLFVSHLPPETTTTPGASPGYDDIEFGYVPLFDEKNDREFMDILPDYLCEEISFPRAQAAKFYAKIVESMSRKVEFDE